MQKELSIAYQEAYIAVNQSLYSQAIPKKYKNLYISRTEEQKVFPSPRSFAYESSTQWALEILVPQKMV